MRIALRAHQPRRRVLSGMVLVGSFLLVLGLVLTGAAAPVGAVATTYAAALSGPNESPANTSPGTGVARVDLDLAAHTLRVQVSFSGLVAPTTASHIHACTSVPLSGTASVATQTPSFIGFPLGVTSGTFDRTFNTLDAATYRAGFLTASGGTAAGAEAVLADCLAAGKAYLNIHSTTFPNGEIRGFLVPPQVAKVSCKDSGFSSLNDPGTGQAFTNQGQCVSFMERQ